MNQNTTVSMDKKANSSVNDWEYVKALANKGLYLYPVIKGTKKPAIKDMINKATNDIDLLEAWFNPDNQGNIKYDVACVPQNSNLIVIDVDNHNGNGGTEWMRNNASNLHPSVIEKTPHGGLHMFFNADDMQADKLPNDLRLSDSVEVKTNSTIIYPSRDYKQTNGNSLAITEITPMNDFLRDKIKAIIQTAKKPKSSNNIAKQGNKVTSKWDEILNSFQNGLSSGDRNNALSKLVSNLYSFHFNDSGVKTFVNMVNDFYCSPSLPQKEIDAMLKSKRNKQHYSLKISDELIKTKSELLELSCYKNGKPVPNVSLNITRICEEELSAKYKYNLFAEDIFVDHGGKLERWQDDDLYWLRQYIEANYNFSPNNDKTTYQGVYKYAKEHPYHPVKNMIEQRNWDGKQRVDSLFIDYLGAEDTKYNRLVAHKLMVGAITRIYRPGCKFDLMPILTGKQGIGKSTLISKLSGGFFLDNLSQLNSSNKDDILKLLDSWIVEVSELEAFKKSSIGGIKAFISSQNLKYRRPYGNANSDYWVHNVYVGTTNEDEFLPDATGNRRFLPVYCGANKPKKDVFSLKGEELYQLYAEAKCLFDKGETLYLNDDEEKLANQHRVNNETYDPVKEAILGYIEMPIPNDWDDFSNYQREEYYKRYQDKGVTSIIKDNTYIELKGNDLDSMKSVATKELLSIPLNKNINKGIHGNDRALSRRVSIVFSGIDEWRQDKNVNIHGKYLRGYKKI